MRTIPFRPIQNWFDIGLSVGLGLKNCHITGADLKALRNRFTRLRNITARLTEGSSGAERKDKFAKLSTCTRIQLDLLGTWFGLLQALEMIQRMLRVVVCPQAVLVSRNRNPTFRAK